nr:MAG TPA: hypothetical protein [Caudoviricetes sp.]
MLSSDSSLLLDKSRFLSNFFGLTFHCSSHIL